MPESWNLRLIGHEPMGAEGDLMHINLKDDYAFVGHMSDRGTSIVDVGDARRPRLVARIPSPANTHGHKVQIVDDVLLVNREKIPGSAGPFVAGMDVYDVSNPLEPRPLAFWPCGGKGVHRMTYWEPPYAFVTAGADDVSNQFLVIVDLSDPTRPQTVGQWALPGMAKGDIAARAWGDQMTVKLHHAIVRDHVAYSAWWDEGIVLLDVSHPTTPSFISQLRFDDPVSRASHTACPLPGRDVLVVTEERWVEGCEGTAPNTRLVDVSDPRRPVVSALFPVPQGDFCVRGGRFGPHNVHEPRPGSLIDGSTVYLTYFNAGIRVFDVSDAAAPVEIAWYIPDPPPGQAAIQLNDVFVAADGLIYVTDRLGGGLYILELEAAAAAARPMA
ncbi:MAG: LVIVD repeat-containing protein [Candidatus Limnocylindrales bacterium]